MKILFNDLSTPVKIGIVSGWVVGVIYLIFFITGLISGAL